MVEKKQTFDDAVVKLDFLSKDDDVFSKAIDNLDKKMKNDSETSATVSKSQEKSK